MKLDYEFVGFKTQGFRVEGHADSHSLAWKFTRLRI